MKPTELKIRNLVYIIKRGCEVHLPIEIPMQILQVGLFNSEVLEADINPGQVTDFIKVPNCDLSPIPLTEKWLIDFGAIIEKSNLDNDIDYGLRTTMSLNVGDFTLIYETQTPFKDPKFHQGHTKMILEGSGGYEDTGELELTDIVKYVHQLQNLYFALTSKELKS